jgi:hypothetical protein
VKAAAVVLLRGPVFAFFEVSGIPIDSWCAGQTGTPAVCLDRLRVPKYIEMIPSPSPTDSW